MSATYSHFTAEFFKGNRDRLRTLFTGTAPIILTANGQLQRAGDTAYTFRQDSNFWYLTGIDEPDAILVMDKGKEYLILPPKSEYQEVFEGIAQATAIREQSGIDMILEADAGWKQLAARLRKVKHIATLAVPPAYISTYAFYTNPARRSLIKKIKKIAPEVELLDLREHLTRLRTIKQPEELQAIQNAIDLTAVALKKALKKREKYGYEHEIEAAITYEFRRKGSQHAYEPIVAAGRNACILHYTQNQAALSPKDIIVIDVGAETDYYGADITRSYAMKPPTKRQQTVYNAVLEVQQYAKSLIKPGIRLRDYEHLVAQFMGETLRKLGLIKTIEPEQVRQYFPHATSHFLGLDIHDVGDYDRPLEAGMVLTIEPGIYIPEENLGIRIEDDVLVTTRGIRVLSRKIPTELW